MRAHWIRSDSLCLMNLSLLNTSSWSSSQRQALVASARELGHRLRQFVGTQTVVV
jgi:hypothetical protein